jgi:hypothetical protein
MKIFEARRGENSTTFVWNELRIYFFLFFEKLFISRGRNLFMDIYEY